MTNPSSSRAWIAPAALALAALSLALNGALLWALRSPERLAGPAVGRALDRLEKSDAKLRYEVRIPAGTPLHFDVPVDEGYLVQLRTTLPIDTEINLPIRTPFGTRTVSVPVNARIPIRQDVPVRLRDTFRLRTATQAEFVIPLEIRVRDLPLDALRQAIDP